MSKVWTWIGLVLWIVACVVVGFATQDSDVKPVDRMTDNSISTDIWERD